MDFSIDDQVIFINESLKGKVIGIKEDTLIIECLKLEFEVHRSEVIKVTGETKKLYSKLKKHVSLVDEVENNFLTEDNSKNFSNELKVNISKNFELDLHIEKLIENFEFLNAQEILQFQMNAFFRGIFKAKRLGLDYLIVIHGIGKGVLKKKIIHFLAKNEAIFCEAEYMLYKGGAVEIKIN